MFLNVRALAATLYVSLNSTNPVPPYADWSTATTNIQDAVDASTNRDLILVTNGLYQTGSRSDENGLLNRVTVTKAVSVESVNGPGVTMIVGNGVRCVYLTNDAVLLGFTLTNGSPSPTLEGLANGGGAWCEDDTSILSNCVITSNSAETGGGVYQGTLNNCWLTSNSAGEGGGGAFGTVLNNCVLNNNHTTGQLRGGGAYDVTMNNCLVVSNSSSGIGGGVVFGTLNNCIVVNNTGGGVAGCTMNNCIVYYNDSNFPNPGGYRYSTTWNASDTTPLPNDFTDTASPDTITNEPLFVNPAIGDFHLQSNSPCINSGNNTYVTSITDLDSNPRIAGGTVDIGAYEYQAPVSKISYAWLQQYGLPITTNIDAADLDDTGFTVYQDWIAGLNPTNSLSVLAMLSPVPTNNPVGLVVSWQSVSNRTYFLQSSTNLAAQPAFLTIQSNIVGQPDVTSFMDTNAAGNGPFFYRVGVQQ